MATGKKDDMLAAINVSVPKPLKEKLDAAAAEDRRTLKATVELILEEWVEKREKGKRKPN